LLVENAGVRSLTYWCDVAVELPRRQSLGSLASGAITPHDRVPEALLEKLARRSEFSGCPWSQWAGNEGTS